MRKIRRFYARLRAFLGKPMIVRQEKVVLKSEFQPCENPIFLAGVHRSGTSLVRRMFNSHHNIACPPESFFLARYCDIYNDPLTASGLEGFGYSADEVRGHIARQAAELHDAYRMVNSKGRWADKTPQYVERLEDLLALFGEQAQFVLIFRDPRDIAFSIFERGWTFSDPSGDLLIDTAEYVRDRVGMLLDFAAVHADKSVTLRYENLVADPKGELTRVLGFLGEEFDESMLRFNDFQHNFGTEDPMVRGTSTLRPSAGNWQALSPKDQAKLSTTLKHVLAQLGYTS